MQRLPIHRTIGTSDELLNELNMAPVQGDTVSVNPCNEMESFFMDTLAKHHGHQLGDWDIDDDERY